jgi:hypothetical protein
MTNLELGTRVEIRGDCVPELIGKTGEIVSSERDCDLILYRVKLDVPMYIKSLDGFVESDIFLASVLRNLEI